MTKEREALRAALKNLLIATKHLDVCPGTVQEAEKALAQLDHLVTKEVSLPEQQPAVAIIEVLGNTWVLDYLSLPVGRHKLYVQQYTHTSPPAREWVGLTFAEVNEIEQNGEFWDNHTTIDFANAIEAKLKELNA